MTIFNKTLGLVMVAYSYYYHYSKDSIMMWSYDFWFVSVSGFAGLILFALGSQVLRDIINKIINKKKNNKIE